MGNSPILFACDLDNTLIHSYKTAEENHICVEQKDGKPLSFMTQKSLALLKQVIELVYFVPVTTRSLEQYNRIEFFSGYNPPYAITSNGGHLIVNKHLDERWYSESRQMLQGAYNELYACMKIFETYEEITLKPRIVDGLFLFAKSQTPEKTIEKLGLFLDLQHVILLNNLDKIYAVPVCLNKGTAVQRLKEKIGAQTVICAGDSLFDVPMLQHADISIAPRNIIPEGCKNISWDNTGYFSEFVLESVLNLVMCHTY